MRKVIFSFKSFQIKLTLAFIFAMFFAGALSIALIYRYTLNSQFNDLRHNLMGIAQTASLLIDADTLPEIPLSRQGMSSPSYNHIAEKLRQVKKSNPAIKYIYILTKTAATGIWQFVVDPNPDMERNRKRWVTSYPGDTYDASRFPEMLKAFEGPQADKKLEVDEWGATLSGYAPIRDKNAKAVAMIGVDMSADTVALAQQEVRKRVGFILFFGIIVSMLLGMFISQRITKPIKRLIEGTRRISKGDLHYVVELKDKDEIGELAASFNQMGKSLFESRKKLLDYFYRVVQSLVRILEARDSYTKGHSERVAEYAQEIALTMGFSKENVGLVKDTALLHDIGKLGINENILNKEGKLTDQEWELIRLHPIIGEDILRPVVLTDEMLLIVRGHHERYDSKGYPDQISGENINIFAAIVCVADAYDAMVSPRAYRPALGKEKAVEELKANRGSQFNPKVVEVFLGILEKM